MTDISPTAKITVLSRALNVLHYMADRGEPVGVTELGRELKIPKATVYRILDTLADFDYVVQEKETNHYLLGIGLLQLSGKVQLEPALVSIVRPYLERLAADTQEIANLGIIHGKKVLVICSVPGRSNSRLAIRLSSSADLHCSSLGKSLLSGMSPDSIRSLLSDTTLQSYTPATRTSVEDLFIDLEKVRATGVAIDAEETEEGLVCFGSPIQDWHGAVIAAISVSAPTARLEGQRANKVQRLVVEAATSISERLRQ